MEGGSVFLIIASFLLLKKEALGDETGVVSPSWKLSSSESFSPIESGSPKGGSSRLTLSPTHFQEAHLEGVFPAKRKSPGGRKFIFHRPIPMKLVHKSTIQSGPVDEATFRRIENEINANTFGETLANNEIYSGEDSNFSKSQRNNKFSSTNKVSSSPQFARKPYSLGNLTPVPGTITGYFASPGKSIRPINGTPKKILDNTLLKRNNYQSATSRLNSLMTITPGIVQSFPIKIMSNNPSSLINFGSSNINDIGNVIFKRYIPSLQNSLKKTTIKKTSRKLDGNPEAPGSNVKIVVLSKVPSKDQPDQFWKNLFKLAPQLANHRHNQEPLTRRRRRPQNNIQIHRGEIKRINNRNNLSS